MSGVLLHSVYGPDGVELSGQYPYNPELYASMYRSRLWTTRSNAIDAAGRLAMVGETMAALGSAR
jgi:hypothetical protein